MTMQQQAELLLQVSSSRHLKKMSLIIIIIATNIFLFIDWCARGGGGGAIIISLPRLWCCCVPCQTGQFQKPILRFNNSLHKNTFDQALVTMNTLRIFPRPSFSMMTIVSVPPFDDDIAYCNRWTTDDGFDMTASSILNRPKGYVKVLWHLAKSISIQFSSLFKTVHSCLW